MPIRLKKRGVLRPLTEEPYASESLKHKSGVKIVNDTVQNISEEDISREERRREATKPIYLVRYE